MATIIFYQKPGCATNGRQRHMLEAAGHVVVTRNLLAEPWTADRLASFFGATPVDSWFNPAAPRIKSGAVDPASVEPATALALMLDDPLLIRRPLIEVDEERCAGFEREPVPSLLHRVPHPDDGACARPETAACPAPRPGAEANR